MRTLSGSYWNCLADLTFVVVNAQVVLAMVVCFTQILFEEEDFIFLAFIS